MENLLAGFRRNKFNDCIFPFFDIDEDIIVCGNFAPRFKSKIEIGGVAEITQRIDRGEINGSILLSSFPSRRIGDGEIRTQESCLKETRIGTHRRKT